METSKWGEYFLYPLYVTIYSTDHKARWSAEANPLAESLSGGFASALVCTAVSVRERRSIDTNGRYC